MISSLYKGFVDHARRRPARHALRYRVFSLLLDLDELDEINRTSRVFGVNRRALLSFWEKDHGAGEGRGLKQWVVAHVTKAGFSATGMRVQILTPAGRHVTVICDHNAGGSAHAARRRRYP